MLTPVRQVSLALLCAVSLGLAGCDEDSQSDDPSSPSDPSSAQAGGLAISSTPCRVEIDSPADGEVDGVVEVTYDGERPQRAQFDYGEGSSMNACVTFDYAGGGLVAKTVHKGDCGDNPAEAKTSTVRSVQGSNLVALTFPDGELTYHYATAPGDFTFLLTRTSYNLGPQKIEDVRIEDGRFQSLTLPTPKAEHTLEADYHAGKLLRVSEKDASGEEIGYASFHYLNGKLHKVRRRLATMNKEQTEEVRLIYRCKGGAKK